MHSKKRAVRIALVAIAAVGALALSGCAAGKTAKQSAPPQELKIGLSADVPDLKPLRDQGGAAMVLDTMLHRGLLGYDGKGEVVPALAKSFKQVDDVTYKFVLRDGLKFSNGESLTSANVKSTLEFLALPQNGAKIYATMSQLASVRTPDSLTAIVTLKAPNVAFPQYLADTTAAILPNEAFAADGTSWIGAGPFVLKKNDKGISFSFAKNPNYYDAAGVSLKDIEVTIYADGKARSNALLAGDVDLIDYVPWEDFDRIKSTSELTLEAQSGPWMYLHFNVTKGPFANEKVRQAVAYAVNRQNVVSAAFSGQAAVTAGAPIDPSSQFYNKKLANGWATDVAKAKALLADAGYPQGFSATLLTSSQYSFHQDTALSVQADLKKIGIDLTLDAPDWATRQTKAAAGEYDIAVAGSAGVVNDPSFLVNFVTGPAANNRSFGFDDPKLDGLLADGISASANARKGVYDKVQERILETVPFASLVSRSQAFAFNKKVVGFSNIPGFLTFESGYTLSGTSIRSK